jgi:XTP/dITP diphosphohydrolase
MRILLASSNPHKLEEIQAIFDALSRDEQTSEPGRVPELTPLPEDGPTEPEETGETFEENAVLKACYYADQMGMPALADDSGLEVDALGGRPGVRSARYAMVSGPRHLVDQANNQLLLQELGDVPRERRTARYVCAMALCLPGQDKPSILVRGQMQGRILGPGDEGYDRKNAKGRGGSGFGYDPLFVVRDGQRTAAELSPAQKNARSHRREAAEMVWRLLQELPQADPLSG